MRRGGRFAGVIIAHQHQHAAQRAGAKQIAVTERIAGAIDAGALAVPNAEHAVVFRLAGERDLLGAGTRGGRQVFVQARLEHDVVLLQKFLRRSQLLIVAAQRRAAIAGNIARRVVAGSEVAAPLHHRQAHQGLNAGQINSAGLLRVFVFELNVSEGRHRLRILVRRAREHRAIRNFSMALSLFPRLVPSRSLI